MVRLLPVAVLLPVRTVGLEALHLSGGHGPLELALVVDPAEEEDKRRICEVDECAACAHLRLLVQGHVQEVVGANQAPGVELHHEIFLGQLGIEPRGHDCGHHISVGLLVLALSVQARVAALGARRVRLLLLLARSPAVVLAALPLPRLEGLHRRVLHGLLLHGQGHELGRLGTAEGAPRPRLWLGVLTRLVSGLLAAALGPAGDN
mmetsp:Transcript_107032/g.320117  ORF Transcript_107032/g.320117 Transcript_107032/m.320117 type:complete len:206 (-) Transcript_107032:6-623(-)